MIEGTAFEDRTQDKMRQMQAEYRRNDPNMNKYNAFILANFRTNHDITFLPNVAATKYVTKYITKAEKQSDILIFMN